MYVGVISSLTTINKLYPDLFVAMAAYGEDAPGYIGTVKAYEEVGYETGTASWVTPETENVLKDAIRKLLRAKK